MNLLQRAGAGVARVALSAAGLPAARPVAPSSPAEVEAYEAAAARIVDAGGARIEPADLPDPMFEFLGWLAENRPVLFHGSPRNDLDELEPVRLSRDSSAFGDQKAVYAASDPIWAAWFAVVARDQNLRGMRNASIGLGRDGRVFPRWYYFSVNRADGTPALSPGTLYVLPSEGFVREHRDFGIVDTGQLVHLGAVRPLARVAVQPSDVPFADCTVTHERGDGELRTILRFARAYRRRAAPPSAR